MGTSVSVRTNTRIRYLPTLQCLCALLCFLFSVPVQAKFKLKIEGVNKVQEDNIRLHLSNWEALPTGKPETVYKQIRNTVNKSLQPLGYYEARVESHIDGNTLSLSIQPGPPVVWGKEDIVIPELMPDVQRQVDRLLASHPFKPGQVINHQTYDQFKKNVLTRIRQSGYLDARWVSNRLLVNLDSHQARVELHLESGQRYRISDIDFSGSALSSNTTYILINTETGIWYDADQLGSIYDNLLGSGYFKYANIDVQQEPPDEATLNIELTDQPSDQFSTGIGYGTDTGMRGKLGWTRSMVNQRGDSIFNSLQVSEIGEELTTQYRIPWPHPLEEYLSWDTGWQREDTTDRESSLFSTGLSYNLSSHNRWQHKFGLNLEHEKYQQGDNEDQVVTYVLPNYRYLLRINKGNKPGNRSLLKLWFNTALGISILDDDARFLGAEVGASYDKELSYRHGFATRFTLGGIATDDLYTVPLSKRFYTGGDQTVRGYKYNSLSTRDADDELLGGQFLNVFSLEYRYRYLPNWMLAVFADTGRAYISSEEPFNTGAGIGIRWQLPVGMFAFDLATPIDHPDENKVRLHVYMSSLL